MREKGVRGVVRERPAAGQLGVAADRGEGGAQLVAGVGDELAQLHLAVLPRLQCRADVVEHVVERRPDLADLGGRVRVRHAFGELHLAAIQRQGGDPPGRRGDAFEGLQLPSHQHRADHARDGQRDRGDDQLGRHEIGHRLLELGFGEAGDLHVAVETGGRDDPVLAERRQVDRHRTHARRHGDHRRQVALREGAVAAAAGADPGVGDLAVRDADGDEVRRAAALRALAEGVRRWPVAPGPVADRREVGVQPGDQRVAHGQRRDQPDHDRRDGQQHERERDQPRAQRPCPQHYAPGLSTYPAPRTVWIIGERPASIFLRR
jgi:Fe2+ transport system protein FeoA